MSPSNKNIGWATTMQKELCQQAPKTLQGSKTQVQSFAARTLWPKSCICRTLDIHLVKLGERINRRPRGGLLQMGYKKPRKLPQVWWSGHSCNADKNFCWNVLEWNWAKGTASKKTIRPRAFKANLIAGLLLKFWKKDLLEMCPGSDPQIPG